MVGFIFVWAMLAVAYVLFAGQPSAEELAFAVGCGLVAAVWSASLRRAAPLKLRYERGAATALARAVAGLPSGTWRVGLKLVRAVATASGGASSTRSFVHGRADDPRDAGRRAVAVLALSLAPDKFVLRTPGGRDEIELHELAAAQPKGDARWPR